MFFKTEKTGKDDSVVTVGNVVEVVSRPVDQLSEQLRKMNAIRPTSATEEGLANLRNLASDLKTNTNPPAVRQEEEVQPDYTSSAKFF